MHVTQDRNSENTRLVLAKKLYLSGCSHTSGKDSVSLMLALNLFDNAVEMVLKCIATKFEIITSSRQDPGFKDLWSKIEGHNKTLPLKDQMHALRDARNAVQHQGDIPSLETVLKYKAYTEDFLKNVSNNIFGIPFEELFLSVLIENETLKKHLLEAEKAHQSVDHMLCIELCDRAVMSAIFDQADIFRTAGALTHYWGASEEFKKIISDDYAERYKENDFYEVVKDLRGAILQIAQASTSMQFLGEYRADFLRYRRVVESLAHLSNDELKSAAEFSLNFATNLILKWQEEGVF